MDRVAQESIRQSEETASSLIACIRPRSPTATQLRLLSGTPQDRQAATGQQESFRVVRIRFTECLVAGCWGRSQVSSPRDQASHCDSQTGIDMMRQL